MGVSGRVTACTYLDLFETVMNALGWGWRWAVLGVLRGLWNRDRGNVYQEGDPSLILVYM